MKPTCTTEKNYDPHANTMGKFATIHRIGSILRLAIRDSLVMSLLIPAEIPFSRNRTDLELLLYSQQDTNIFLTRCCAAYPNSSYTNIPGMKFDLL